MIKDMFAAISIIFIAALVVAVLWIGGGFLGLWWYPYSIQRQTAIVRGSNGYITAKQEELANLVVGYHAATDQGQRKAIMIEICADAAMIPAEYVSVSVARVTAGGCQ